MCINKYENQLFFKKSSYLAMEFVDSGFFLLYINSLILKKLS